MLTLSNMRNLYDKRIILLENRYGIVVDVYEPQDVKNENRAMSIAEGTQESLPVFFESLINTELISTSQEYLYPEKASYQETYLIPYIYRSQYGFVKELDLYDGEEIRMFVSLNKRIPDRNSKLVCLLRDDRIAQFRVFRSRIVSGLNQKQAIAIVNLKPYS